MNDLAQQSMSMHICFPKNLRISIEFFFSKLPFEQIFKDCVIIFDNWDSEKVNLVEQ